MLKRFYKIVDVAERDGAFAVLLDGKPIKTPARQPLELPTQALADAIVQEWKEQGVRIAHETMPLTRLAYGAIDGASQRARLVEESLKYARSDLLCYRAEMPPELIARQARDWNSLLEWARVELHARLNTTRGIGHIEQPAEALAALEARLKSLDDYALVATQAAIA
ncbi:MAG TPA: ATP12 family chaperone protein, partial [Rhizomicrobium sp.]|nr:ATP12 family chaperone protein [Rhizomicrobium sp.]